MRPLTKLILKGRACAAYFIADNGCFHGEAFLKSAEKRDRTRLAALLKLVTEAGRLANDQMGHWLKGRFKHVFEFKTRHCRIFALKRGPDYFIISGAHKTKPKQQEKDYERALELRNKFVAQFDQEDANDQRRR